MNPSARSRTDAPGGSASRPVIWGFYVPLRIYPLRAAMTASRRSVARSSPTVILSESVETRSGEVTHQDSLVPQPARDRHGADPRRWRGEARNSHVRAPPVHPSASSRSLSARALTKHGAHDQTVVRAILERGHRTRDRAPVDWVRVAYRVEVGDQRRVAKRISDAQPGECMRLRKRPDDEPVRMRREERNARRRGEIAVGLVDGDNPTGFPEPRLQRGRLESSAQSVSWG